MDKKVLRWNFVFQYGWVLTNVINSILLLPFYLKYIDINTLGVWLAATSILYWMTMVDPGIGEVLQQKIAEFKGKKENKEIGVTIGSGIMSSGIILIIAAVAGLIFYFCLGIFLKKDVSQYENLSIALLITICATGLSLVSFTLTGINQGLHNSQQVAISSLLGNLVFLIVNLVFLFMGYGVLSIALANMLRAIFLNGYIFISMKKLLNRESILIKFDRSHFNVFIKIFSFTSLSKIITGLSNSLDMVVLARYIAPSMITIYEINKRPLNFTNTLIGRHSVALMPVVSHAKGKGDKSAIVSLVGKQLKFYVYASLFAAFIFACNYSNLISLWVGEGKFIGTPILNLLIISSFIALISYFLFNMGYAYGDIKFLSKYNIIRNIIFGILVVISARYFGIIGTVVVSLIMSLCTDLIFFSYRLLKLGILERSIIRKIGSICLIIIPSGIVVGWLLSVLVNNLFTSQMYLSKILVNGSAFSLFFVLLLLVIDPSLRAMVRQLKNKLTFNFASL